MFLDDMEDALAKWTIHLFPHMLISWNMSYIRTDMIVSFVFILLIQSSWNLDAVTH